MDKFHHYVEGQTHAEMLQPPWNFVPMHPKVALLLNPDGEFRPPAQPCTTFIQTLDAPMLDIRVLRCVCLRVSPAYLRK